MIGSHSPTVFAMSADSALQFISNSTIQIKFRREINHTRCLKLTYLAISIVAVWECLPHQKEKYKNREKGVFTATLYYIRPVSSVVLLPCRTQLIELNSTLARQ